MAKLQKITDLESFLPLFLAGPAFAVYKQLPESDKEDYGKLKAALLTAFGINCYTAYDELQKRVLRDGEPVDVYLADIKRLVAHIGQKDAEPISKCAFMAGLPGDVSMQLKSMASVEKLSLPELVARARIMLSTRESEMACAAGYQKAKGTCFNCGSTSHMARECPKSTRRNYQPRYVRRCFICDQTSHIARNCPEKLGNGQGEPSAPGVSPRLQ